MKTFSHKIFTIDSHISITCHAENTRYGFRHLATLLIDGYSSGTAKVCYYNHTWESYEFQSVILSLADKSKATPDVREKIRTFAKGYQENNSIFSAVAAVAALGSLLTSTQKESNDWKIRMIKAGLGDYGLTVPDDWDTLSEDEKTRRLDGVIEVLKVNP